MTLSKEEETAVSRYYDELSLHHSKCSDTFGKMVEKLHELGLAKVDVSRSEVALLF